ncbi:hypothetical protein AMTRI_Chr06g191110 [Amborella trichopoda]
MSPNYLAPLLSKYLAPLLPLQDLPPKPTVFLDLDETLIKSFNTQPPTFDFKVQVLRPPRMPEKIYKFQSFLGRMTYYISRRPGIDELLSFLHGKYEIVIFTASTKEYADPIIDKIDKYRVISYRLYRNSCKIVDGKCIKDLSRTGRNIKRLIIIDDKLSSFSLQKNNGIQVSAFVGDPGDKGLLQLLKFFEIAVDFEDMREAATCYLFSLLKI